MKILNLAYHFFRAIVISILWCFCNAWFTTSAYAMDIHSYFQQIQSDPQKLHAFLKAMPKGGELHYHLSGGVYPEVMLSVAPLGHYCMNPATYSIDPNKAPCGDNVDLSHLQKNSALYEHIVRAWSLKDFKEMKESNYDHFFATFFMSYPLVADYSPRFLANILTRAAKQHEQYMEIMILPDENQAATFANQIKGVASLAQKRNLLLQNPAFQHLIQKSVEKTTTLLQKTRQELHCQQKTPPAACDITVKFQSNILREQPIDALFAQALNGFEAVSRTPQLVSVNLVQPEDGVISLKDYKAHMRIIAFLHHLYPTVHISLHAGELDPERIKTLQRDPKALTFHIHDALHIAGAERIGHGVDILHEQHPERLFAYMRTHQIPVEINLTSNEKLLHIKDNAHPLPHYLAHQVPIVLSSDDEGILRTSLTQQYLKAVKQYHLDYATIKTINRNTLTYSFLPGKSLWKNPAKGVPVKDCLALHSQRCLTFIQHSEKARLQWQLENKLQAFEQMK